MNWISTQRLCAWKTHDCLAKLKGSLGMQSNNLGSGYYLHICVDYIDSFCFKQTRLEESCNPSRYGCD